MMIPIRCFTCGKLIGDKFADFESKVKAGEDPGKVLDELKIKRYCCRRMLISSVTSSTRSSRTTPRRTRPLSQTSEQREAKREHSRTAQDGERDLVSMRIQDVKVRVCFNGRGDPGIEADVMVDGELGRAISPSGASRGTNEAVPFVDDDPDKTVSQFNKNLRRKDQGARRRRLEGITWALRKIDGTKNYSRIGGSLAYAVSVAAAEAEAKARGVPMCRVIDPKSGTLPFPLGNTIGGGKHASDLSPAFQEILVAPSWRAQRARGDRAEPQGPQGRGEEALEDAQYPVARETREAGPLA